MKFFKRFAAFAVSACLFVSVLSSCRPGSVLNPVIYTDVIISELMPNNSSTYADSSGRYSDWVELCNPTSREINLSGYGLSDDPNNPFKFTFPDCVLKPDEYFIVLLDGENRFNDGEMHCSFGISSAGGETVVRLTGSGLGGRNQEVALSAAPALAGLAGAAVFSVGSDGTDGPTDAAGGYVDGATRAALAHKGLSIYDVLRDNDAYHALEACGGLIVTGATGTNVNDVAVLLIAVGS